MRQLWTYTGSKWRIMRTYVQYLPPRYRHFVSPCVGTGAELAFKQIDPIETINDKDRDVWNVYRVIQDARLCRQLMKMIACTPNGREQHRYCRSILDLPPSSRLSLRRAWAFLIAGNTCRFGIHPGITRTWSTDDKSTQRLRSLPTWIKWWRERLRCVRLECDDWQAIVKRYDDYDTCFFLDPPYPFSVRRSCAKLYRHELTAVQHEEMLRVLIGIKGYAMMCGYDTPPNPLYTSYLWHWWRFRFQTRCAMNVAKGRVPSPREEVLWLNYDPETGRKIARNKLLIVRRCVDYVGGLEAAQRYLDKVRRLTELPK